MTSFAWLAPTALATRDWASCSHYDVIRYWAGHAQRYGCAYVRTDTLPRLMCIDVINWCWYSDFTASHWAVPEGRDDHLEQGSQTRATRCITANRKRSDSARDKYSASHHIV